jgi:hypothetical protein
VLEFADQIHAFVSLQQRRQSLLHRRRHRLAEHLRYPTSLAGHHSAYQVLHEGVSRRHNPLILQVPQGFAQNRDRLRRKHGNPLRFECQLRFRCVVTTSVIEQPQNDLLLFEAGWFGERLDACVLPIRAITAQEILEIGTD